MRWCIAVLALWPCGAAMADLPPAVADADYAPVDMAQVALGRMLFYDPILSGNRNISCSTCHHPRFATSDGLPLGLGEGGVGLGPERRTDPANLPEERIPRHSPALFNLGAREFTTLFHDGRIEVDLTKTGGFRTPMGEDMSAGFANLLSAQTMFPVLSADEMAGHYSENDVAQAVRQGRITGPGGAWNILAHRIASTETYKPLIKDAFGSDRVFDFTAVSDAIAAFVAFEWRSDTSSFDAYLRGTGVLSDAQTEGMALFYGAAGCAACHSGPFQTDHAFHAMGVAQFGPGKAARFESHVRDTGRLGVTGRAADAYAFRTPSLRNVAHTAPYGHTGSHADLAAFVADHAVPRAALDRFDRSAVVLPPLPGADDWRHLDDPAEQAALRAAIAMPDTPLETTQIAKIVAFLGSLSDPVALTGRLGVPDAVPSGLPFEK